MLLTSFQRRRPSVVVILSVLHLSNVSLNGGAIPVLTIDGIHLVAYVADGDGNGGYASNDATLIVRPERAKSQRATELPADEAAPPGPDSDSGSEQDRAPHSPQPPGRTQPRPRMAMGACSPPEAELDRVAARRNRDPIRPPCPLSVALRPPIGRDESRRCPLRSLIAGPPLGKPFARGAGRPNPEDDLGSSGRRC